MSDQLPGLLTPTKDGFGRFLGEFYTQFRPLTKATAEWKTRGMPRAMVWAPGRMIDQAELMLQSWRKNANTAAGSSRAQPGGTAFLPVVVAAMGKDWTPVQGDAGRQVSEQLSVMLPDDVLQRYYGLRVMEAEVRTQIAVFAAESETAGAIVSQLCMFLADMRRRTFQAVYNFAGQDLEWPVQVQTPDVAAVPLPSEQQNLTIITVDLTLRPTIPLFDAPAEGEPNDGQGVPGDWVSPPGYPTVRQVDANGRTVAKVEA